LGCLNYCLMFMIFLYVAVYQIFYHCGYLLKPDVELSMRATLRAPANLTAFKDLSYCCHTSGVCPPTTLRCEVFSGPSVLHVHEEAMTVVTRRKIKGEGGVISDHYVADIENFTLLVEPTVYSITKDPHHQPSIMPGHRMVGHLAVGAFSQGHVVNDVQHALCRERGLRHEAFLHPSGQGRGKVTKAPCYISADFTINNNEVFRLDTLMRAMGISLDHDVTAHQGRSIRHVGLVIMLLLEVHSFEYGRGLLKRPFFVLKPIWANNTQYSRERSGFGMETVDDYGLHFLLQPGGTLATFSFNHLLEEVTTSLALFAASSIVVKFLAVYAFPLGGIYYTAMTRETPDIRQVEKLALVPDEQLQAEHRKLFGNAARGSKEELLLSLSSVHEDSSETE
ncbi:unnamed protein product, partial [Cladocopium goreaui]